MEFIQENTQHTTVFVDQFMEYCNVLGFGIHYLVFVFGILFSLLLAAQLSKHLSC